MTPDILAAVHAAADAHRVEPALLAAFVEAESSGDPKATRYEPGTARYVDVGDALRLAVGAGVTEGEEVREQMTSWGLMQIMGFNARLLGYRSALQDLRWDITAGLELGCAWLKHLQVMFSGEIPVPSPTKPLAFSEALACAYNHGRPARTAGGKWVVQAYVDRVAHFYREFVAQGL